MGFSIGGAADPPDVRDGTAEGRLGGAAGAAMRDSGPMDPTTFGRPEAFRTWLEQHHDSEHELWVGSFKKGRQAQHDVAESVDQALCFGWIDGIRKRIDADRYMIRFTSRRTGNVWSVVNIGRVPPVLEVLGLAEVEHQPRNDRMRAI